MRISGFIAALFILSCYEPRPVACSCDPSNPYCEDGEQCNSAGVCVPDGTPLDGGMAPQDGSSGLGVCSPLDQASQYLACKGTFASGGAKALCPNGYGLFYGSPMQSIQAACQGVSGAFFATNTPSYANPASPQTSGSCTSVPGWIYRLEGCGNNQGTTSASPCFGWPSAVVCSTSSGWNCPDGTLDTASNSNTLDGVICLKNP